MKSWLWPPLTFLLLWTALPLAAQVDDQQPEGSTVQSDVGLALPTGRYFVRPGDTLQSITARFLGSASRWEENWRLNDERIDDPNRIYPGQYLVVLVPGLPEDGVVISKKSNQVENQPVPLDWLEARRRDLLQSEDNVRTREKSSAELTFPDGTRVTLSESSLVVVGFENEEETVDRTEIQIAVGQADLEASAQSDKAPSDIQVTLGSGTIAKPSANAAGEIRTRLRFQEEEDAAQLMVYEGSSDLSAGGEAVSVGEGMGSSVAVGQPPSPPEKLLPAAAGLDPSPQAELSEVRPLFQWDVVDGAAHYTVEICGDESCGVLLARATGLETNRWRATDDLPVGSHFWRVTATSPSGLDGYPTETAVFDRVDRPADATPPAIAISVKGPQAQMTEERFILGPGFEFEVAVDDGDSGVEAWTVWLDGEKTTLEALEEREWQAGEHFFEVVASDRAGNEGRETLEFIYDDVPPKIRYGLQGVGEVGRGLENLFQEDGAAAKGMGRATLSAGGREWFMDSDFTQVIVKPGTRKVRLRGFDATVTQEQGLWVLVEDEICRWLDRLHYELEDRELGGRRSTAVLVVDGTDCVGNRMRIAWPLEVGRDKRSNRGGR